MIHECGFQAKTMNREGQYFGCRQLGVAYGRAVVRSSICAWRFDVRSESSHLPCSSDPADRSRRIPYTFSSLTDTPNFLDSQPFRGLYNVP